ncbi:hypothetical protein [Clostridium thermobutyricum]|uniref:hypothetical protein n=1 Tax=Clostridium thermobutyricum TaxID=29372 RepID=UPI0018AA4C0E|nr:hypothetical protein [Clostridium thermobutyricum]
MYHDFILVKKTTINTKNKFDKLISNYFNNNKDEISFVKIRDDLILYIFDTLKWLESDFYELGVRKGISYHGITIIKDENAKKAKDIIEAWKNLFSNGDEVIKLTGEYIFENELEYDEFGKKYYKYGQYKKIFLKKDEVLKSLEGLEKFLKISSENKEYCVVHFGI